MTSFLSPAGAGALAAIARDRMLVVLDLDGALAVASRAGPALRAATGALLRATALLYPCAVISRMRRAEVTALVGSAPVVAALGCHGAEPGFGPLDAAAVREVDTWGPRRAAAVRRDAVAQLCRRLHVASAAYVGSGPADEEAFRLPSVGVSIRIGLRAASAAAYRLAEQTQVDDLLRALVAARVDADGEVATCQGILRAVGG